jgi:hypothetical protein
MISGDSTGVRISGLKESKKIFSVGIDYALNEQKITPVCIPFAYMLYIFVFSVNMIVQYFIFSILFLDGPKEDTVSDRLSRYKNEHEGWRHDLAVWIGSHFLDPFDRRGYHI